MKKLVVWVVLLHCVFPGCQKESYVTILDQRHEKNAPYISDVLGIPWSRVLHGEANCGVYFLMADEIQKAEDILQDAIQHSEEIIIREPRGGWRLGDGDTKIWTVIWEESVISDRKIICEWGTNFRLTQTPDDLVAVNECIIDGEPTMSFIIKPSQIKFHLFDRSVPGNYYLSIHNHYSLQRLEAEPSQLFLDKISNFLREN